MKQAICRFIYYRLLGWTAEVSVPKLDKCIYCVAPHTSNWDLFLGKIAIATLGWESGFMMKKEWFFFPLGPIFRWMGGIPIERKKHTSTVDAVAAVARESSKFHLAITPEGTRSANPDWKKGFYYIALGAKVPILVAYIDYKQKEVGMKTLIHPTGDYEKDLAAIQSLYKGVTGCHPEQFAQG